MARILQSRISLSFLLCLLLLLCPFCYTTEAQPLNGSKEGGSLGRRIDAGGRKKSFRKFPFEGKKTSGPSPAGPGQGHGHNADVPASS
ncbi:hypothetical protein Ancab_029009 [Ancistrocladus abbreviatus]